jgi:hypothetical protein
MAINGDYPQPVTVNGFACKNCTDVDYAKKHIDPAHPKDGPYGVNAKDHDSGKAGPTKADEADRDSAKAKRVKVWSEPGAQVDVDI